VGKRCGGGKVIWQFRVPLTTARAWAYLPKRLGLRVNPNMDDERVDRREARFTSKRAPPPHPALTPLTPRVNPFRDGGVFTLKRRVGGRRGSK